MRTKVMMWAIILFLTPTLAYAQVQNEALVQELYTKSGMAKEVELLPLVIQASFEQSTRQDDSLDKLPKHLTAAISALALEAFAAERMREVVLTAFRDKLTVQDMQKVLEWLDSPLGKSITQMEEAASTPEAVADMQQYGGRIKKSPPPGARLADLKKLDIATKSTETNVEIALATQVAVSLGVNYTLPVEQQVPLKVFKRELEKSRPQIEAEVRKETLISLLYTYQKLTEAEIKQYIKFLTSPAGKKFVAVGNAALKEALWEGNVRWGKAIGEALKQEENKSEV